MREEYIVEEKKIGKYTVKVVQDTDPYNPREECDNLAHMVCFHRRYNLGDKHSFSDPEDEDLQELLKRKDVLWLPLYLYDHSGLTINTNGFHCRFDSGQIGIIYVTKAEWREAMQCKRVNKKEVYKYLNAEVETYDDYLTGEVYGYRVEDETGSVVDSCWGFFGDSKYCLEEGISVANHHIWQDIKQHVEKVKQWIRNRVPLEKREALHV